MPDAVKHSIFSKSSEFNLGGGRLKAIITDLDGTLLRSDKTISEYTVRVFTECRKRGMMIFAATARPERSVKAYRDQIVFDAVTTLNGAKIILNGHFFENVIPHFSGEKVLAGILEIPGILISVETREGLFANIDRPEWGSVFVEGFPKLPEKGSLYKILISGENVVSRAQIERVLTEDVYCTAAGGNLFQIMSKKATKWNGIKVMLDSFGICENEAVYFGDDYDDAEPIRNCGMGVAVSNANSDVISAAKYITLSNDEDGPAHFIEQNLL